MHLSKLLWQAETSESATKDEKERSIADVYQCLKLIVCDDICVHYALEKQHGRPGSDDKMPESCDGMCPLCSGEHDSETSVLHVKPMQRALFKMLKDSLNVLLGSTQDGSHFTAKLREVSLKEKAWVGSRRAGDARMTIDAHTVDMLVLQLFGANIIEHYFIKAKDKDGKEQIVVCVRGAMNDDEAGFRFSENTAYDGAPKATF